MNKENRAKLKAALAAAYAETIYEGTSLVSRRVYMQPFGKERPRFVGQGRPPHMPTEYQWRRDKLAELFGDVPMQGQPLTLTVLAVRGMPASWSQAKKERTVGSWCLAKPDADNILGAVMDSLFREDSHIVDPRCPKIWGWTDCLQITISSALEVAPPIFKAGRLAASYMMAV